MPVCLIHSQRPQRCFDTSAGRFKWLFPLLLTFTLNYLFILRAKEKRREGWEWNTTLCRETGVFLACQPAAVVQWLQFYIIIAASNTFIYYIICTMTIAKTIKPKRVLHSKDKAMRGTNSTLGRNHALTGGGRHLL